MDDLRAKALENTANRQFADNAVAIQEEILEGCKDTDSYEVIYSKMIFNAIRISTILSTIAPMDSIVEILIALKIIFE